MNWIKSLNIYMIVLPFSDVKLSIPLANTLRKGIILRIVEDILIIFFEGVLFCLLFWGLFPPSPRDKRSSPCLDDTQFKFKGFSFFLSFSTRGQEGDVVAAEIVCTVFISHKTLAHERRGHIFNSCLFLASVVRLPAPLCRVSFYY